MKVSRVASSPKFIRHGTASTSEVHTRLRTSRAVYDDITGWTVREIFVNVVQLTHPPLKRQVLPYASNPKQGFIRVLEEVGVS